MFNFWNRIIKYIKNWFNIICNNIHLFYGYKNLIFDKFYGYKNLISDKFYRLFGCFIEALFRFRCNQLAHLSDRELDLRLQMIGKLAIGLLTLHIGFPFVGFKWLMRSAVNINANIKSRYEQNVEDLFNRSNRPQNWIYIQFLIQRRAFIQNIAQYGNQETHLDLLDGMDFQFIRWAFEDGKGDVKLILDLLGIRELQGLPRYPKGWAEWEGAASFK